MQMSVSYIHEIVHSSSSCIVLTVSLFLKKKMSQQHYWGQTESSKSFSSIGMHPESAYFSLEPLHAYQLHLPRKPFAKIQITN